MAYISKNTRQGNRAGRSARYELKCASLSSDFGMKMLRAKFAADAELYLAKLGVYSRGPRKGLPRGYIHWVKVVEGGWDYNPRSGRGVMYPGCIEWAVRESMSPESAYVDIPRDPTPYYARNEANRAKEEADELEGQTLLLQDANAPAEAIAAVRAEIVARFQRYRDRNAERFTAELAQYQQERDALLAATK